ncbi:MAG: hypothetical protein WA397_26840 [Roseiarcus sp.]
MGAVVFPHNAPGARGKKGPKSFQWPSAPADPSASRAVLSGAGSLLSLSAAHPERILASVFILDARRAEDLAATPQP